MSAVLFVAMATLAQPAEEVGERAELELVVVRDGTPIANANLFVGEANYGATDEQGALIAQIPSGRRTIRVTEGEQTLLELDLLTDVGELILIIATINPGEEPDLVIESSGRDSVLASEANPAATAAAGVKKEDRPPGALVGTVISGDDQRPVPRAQVFFSGITIQVETDRQGRFEVELPAGTYAVSVVHPRFSSQTLDNIRVIPERQIELNIELTPAGIRLQDYVVTAPYVEGSIASVVEQQREASGVSDVLGAAQIEATGDSNAAEALTRVTGLTVEDGKFVLIRGQPSRFTLALFNGSPLPSPEPLQRVVPLDLFPTGVLQGIEVQKSYSPDAPGAFGAGLVQLNTRGVPPESFFKISLGGAYNSETTLEQGLSYLGGSRDWLGLDDGTRALPSEVAQATQDGTVAINSQNFEPEEVTALASTFPNILNTREKTLPPNFGVGLSAGGSVSLPGNGSFGVVANAGWTNKWQRQERIQRDFAAVAGPALEVRSDLREDRTDNEVTLSSLITAAAEWDDHELKLNTFLVNQSQQRTQVTTGRRITSDILDIRQTLLSWIERFLLAEQLIGRHDFGPVQLEYRALYSQAKRDAPDRREYEYSATLLNRTFIIREPDGLIRSYSFVDDTQYGFGVDLSSDYFAREDSWFRIKPKVGVAYDRVTRDAGTQRFLWLPTTFMGLDEPNPEVFFEGSLTGDTLELIDLSTRGADDYTGFSEILGYYGMVDIEVGDLLRFVGGVRQETADFQVDTFQASVADSEVISTGFEQSELLPSASLTWFLLDDLQVRAAYGRTTSRPVFNELTPSFFSDPDSGQTFIGNPELGPTIIDGYDIRAEWYPSTTESLTAGVFRKDYEAPLERTFIAQGGGGQVATFQNAESAEVQGIEFGGRFEFGRIRDWFGGPSFLELFYFSANAAFLDSQVTLVDQGRATDSNRTLDGQADVVFNAQFGFNAEDHAFTAAYNHVGVRLARVGIRNQPNILQRPIDVLDINYTWHITDSLDLKLSGGNLLNTKISLTQQIEGEQRQVFREFQNGRTFSASVSYTF